MILKLILSDITNAYHDSNHNSNSVILQPQTVYTQNMFPLTASETWPICWHIKINQHSLYGKMSKKCRAGRCNIILWGYFIETNFFNTNIFFMKIFVTEICVIICVDFTFFLCQFYTFLIISIVKFKNCCHWFLCNKYQNAESLG